MPDPNLPPTRLTLTTPSRLHFGLLALDRPGPRAFGGVGLMIDRPGVRIAATPAADWAASGPLADRVAGVAAVAAQRLRDRGIEPVHARFEVLDAPPEHVGLGVGTQVGLAVARLVAEQAGLRDPTIGELAALSGRGLRSGVGLHGFDRGGLIVDGGRGPNSAIPPLLARHTFPATWSALIVIPPLGPGLHGPGELRAFSDLPPFPDALTSRLARIILLELLPAVAEADLVAFGRALEALQAGVGRGFAAEQAGPYATAASADVARVLRSEGLVGIGQSSWGPALYGFAEADEAARAALRARVLGRLGFAPNDATWAHGAARGACIEADPPPTPGSAGPLSGIADGLGREPAPAEPDGARSNGGA